LTAFVFPKTANSLVKKYLSQKVWCALENRKTDSGFTLAKAINSGLKNPDSEIGIYAGDAQSYETFSMIFDPVISEYHGCPENLKQKSDITALDLPDLDPEGKYIQSTRIRAARNLKGFNFTCHMTLSQRRELEKNILTALGCLKGNLKGDYFSLERDGKNFSPHKITYLGFQKGDRFQDAAGINSDFPKSRGVYHSFDGKLMVWVNEEDHLRIISLEKTSDISGVYNRFFQAISALNQNLDFAWDKKLGNLTSCPTNIGTAMRAGVHIQLEKLEKKKESLLKLIRAYNLQIRGTRGEKTKIQNAVFDISNRQRLGISESDIIKNLHAGLLAIITVEKNL